MGRTGWRPAGIEAAYDGRSILSGDSLFEKDGWNHYTTVYNGCFSGRRSTSSKARAAGVKQGEDRQEELNTVLYPGGHLGGSGLPANSVYGRSFRGSPEKAVLAAARDFGVDRSWMPAPPGATRERCVAHEPEQEWAPGLVTTYDANQPSPESWEKVLRSKERFLRRKPMTFEEQEERWLQWHQRRNRTAKWRDSAAGSAATELSLSTMPAGAERPRPPQCGRVVGSELAPFMKDGAGHSTDLAPPETVREVSLNAVRRPSPIWTKPTMFPSPQAPSQARPEKPSDVRWSSRFRSMIATYRPKFEAKPEAMGRRGEDLG